MIYISIIIILIKIQSQKLYRSSIILFLFFFNDTATTEIYTLSLHDALPISEKSHGYAVDIHRSGTHLLSLRSEEHTSELQSPPDLVCRLLLEKKKNIK